MREDGDGGVGPKMDGRLARSARTFCAVVEAFLSLLEEGDLRPTAARVADRAGVSRRSVYVHFRDLESLFAAAAERHFATRLGPMIDEGPLPEPLPERLRTFVDAKASLFESVTPVRRAAALQEPFSKEVADQLAVARQRATAEAERVFAAELAEVGEERRPVVAAALGVTVTWPTWDSLRRSAGLSVDGAKAVLSHMILGVLRS